jgi:subtilisin family serine protease
MLRQYRLSRTNTLVLLILLNFAPLSLSISAAEHQSSGSMWQGGFAWMRAPQVWDGHGNQQGTMGEHVVVGLIDTGINPYAPSFAAKGDDGYTITNPKGKYFGVCDPDKSVYDPSFPCNGKLIGAWGYPKIDKGSPIDDTLGHGSFMASISVGDIVNHAAYITYSGHRISKKIAGIAPHANLISYRICDHKGCLESAILLAIDRAIQDGVDIINFSIGTPSTSIQGTLDPWAGVVSKAFLTAENAGIFVSVSAGNNGPKPETLDYNVPAAPWVTTVAYSTHNLRYESVLTNMRGGVMPPPHIDGQSFSEGYHQALIVDAADFGNPYCLNDSYSTKFNGAIVICRVKQDQSNFLSPLLDSVFANGGGAVVMIMDKYTPDGKLLGPGYRNFSPYDTHQGQPFIVISHQDGQRLLAWMSQGKNHYAALSQMRLAEDDSRADIMNVHSSRGPQKSTPSLLKPDITAPGQLTFGAYTAAKGYSLGEGSSEAAAQISGAAALVKAKHPDWAPMEIQSALMTTARTHLRREDGLHAATPFDMGAGRVDVSRAVRAGLVLNETMPHFLAASPYQGGEPASLNLSSLGEVNCVVHCTWTRVVRNGSTQTTTWLAESNLAVTVQPAMFSLSPGEKQTLTFTADVSGSPVGQWQFTQVHFKSMTANIPDVHFPVAAKSAASNFSQSREVNMIARQPTGQKRLAGLRALEITHAQVKVLGAAKSAVIRGTIPSASGVGTISSDERYTYKFMQVPNGAQRFVAEITDTDANNLDLYIGTGETVDLDQAIGKALHGRRPKELLNVKIPMEATTLWVAVQNYREFDADKVVNFSLNTAFLSTAAGNLTVSIPDFVPSSQPFSANIAFHLPGSQPGDEYYGLATFGTDNMHPENLGSKLIHIVRQ